MDVEQHDEHRPAGVGHGHEGHDLFGDPPHPGDAAGDGDAYDPRDRKAGGQRRNVKGVPQALGDGVCLRHVAHAQRAQQAEKAERRRETAAVQALLDVEHRPSHRVASAAGAAVEGGENVLCIGGHGAQQCREPHPEHRPRPARHQRGGHAGDVSRAQSCRQRRAGRLESGGRATLASTFERRAQGPPQPEAHSAQLEKTGGCAEHNTA